VGPADKNTLKSAHGLAFFGKMQYSLLQLAPLIVGVGKQATVHAGNHDAVGPTGLDHITKPRWNDNSPFGVNGMKGASPKHLSPVLSTLVHLFGIKV
jgi:hypothetical protein